MSQELSPHPLEALAFEKDLGVVFYDDLKVRGQCEEAYSKASQMLGLINRTVIVVGLLEGSRVMGWWLVLLVSLITP